MTKSSISNNHSVFEFGEEDEAPELTSRSFLSKFKNKSNPKCAQKVSDLNFEPHTTGNSHSKTDDAPNREERVRSFVKSELNIRDDDDTSVLNLSLTGYPFPNEEPGDKLNQESEHIEYDNSFLTPNSNIEEYSGSSEVSDSDIRSGEGDSESGDMDNEVIIRPDYIIFRDNYFTVSSLSFQSTGITLECFPWSKHTCFYKWKVADIFLITSYSNRKVDYVVVTVRMKPPLGHHEDDVDVVVDEVKFAVVGLNWVRKQEKIFSLHTIYGNIWNELDGENEFNDYLLERKCYFPNFDDFENEVVYPKGDTDAVSISKRDIALLNPDTFINDTIIDFYLKFLRNKLVAGKNDRFHFFNSFFFRKLADLDKDNCDSFDGRAAFLRVHKWTRKINLFEMDYIFIPVNFSLHWSLIVICHAGEVATFNNENLINSPRVPCILHMDSLSGSHKGLKSIIQCYLMHEWKDRMNETCEDILSKFLHTRFVSLELPQQENLYDCGLFLLHYAEKFLEEAPHNFNPFKLNKFSNFLSEDWFPSAEVSLKRTAIQRIIHGISVPETTKPDPNSSDNECSGEGFEGDPPPGSVYSTEPEFTSALSRSDICIPREERDLGWDMEQDQVSTDCCWEARLEYGFVFEGELSDDEERAKKRRNM